MLTASKVLFMVRIANFTTTPLSNAIVSATSRNTTTTAETRGGATRSSWRIEETDQPPMSCPISTTANSTINDSAAASG